MLIKDKIKELRQKKSWSQGQLALKLKANQKQISAYERGVHIPSSEMLIKMAQIFDVSVDYLVFETEANVNPGIKDRELFKQFEQIDNLNDNDRQLVKEILNLVILKNKFQNLLEPSNSR